MLWIILGTITSYLIGALPTAFILGKILKGKDLRQFGSHNVGATNAFRVLGKGIGVSVLLIDIIKGIIPVVFIGDYIIAKSAFLSPELIRNAFGIAATCGHNWTVFLGFKGGKGVAVTCGVLIGLAIKYAGLRSVFIYILGIWVVTFLIFRMVSAASLLSSIALPVFMILLKQGYALIMMSIILLVFIILRHKSNIQRILVGKEPRIK